MQQARWKQYFLACTGVLIMAAGYVAWSYFHRPLFFNYFGFHPDRLSLPEWWPVPGPERDASGNLIHFDFPLNIILCVRWNDAQRYSPVWPRTQGTDLLIEPSNNQEIIRVKLERDHLYFVDPTSGSVKTAVLPMGASRAVYRRVPNEGIPNLGQFLKTQLPLPFDPSVGG